MLPVVIVQSDDSDSSADDLSDIEKASKLNKSAVKRAHEELLSSGDDDDEEILHTHREEMIKFMVQVHRRKRRIIEEYEKKDAVSTDQAVWQQATNTVYAETPC